MAGYMALPVSVRGSGLSLGMRHRRKQRPPKPCSHCEVHTLVAPDTLHGPCNSAELGCSICKCFSSLIAIRNNI